MKSLEQEVIAQSTGFDGNKGTVTIPLEQLNRIVTAAASALTQPLFARMFTQEARIDELLASNSALTARARKAEAERDACLERCAEQREALPEAAHG
jgi:hypothetical protein